MRSKCGKEGKYKANVGKVARDRNDEEKGVGYEDRTGDRSLSVESG